MGSLLVIGALSVAGACVYEGIKWLQTYRATGQSPALVEAPQPFESEPVPALAAPIEQSPPAPAEELTEEQRQELRREMDDLLIAMGMPATEGEAAALHERFFYREWEPAHELPGPGLPANDNKTTAEIVEAISRSLARPLPESPDPPAQN